MKFRTKEQIAGHLRIEWKILKSEWVWVLIGLLYEYVSLVAHNLVYYLHRQSPMVRDLGFELLGYLTGPIASIPDYMVYVMFALIGFYCVANIILRPGYFRTSEVLGRAPKRPYVIFILRRCLVSLGIAFIFRSMSFLSTILPGPGEHCQPVYDEECINETPGCNGIGVGSCMIPNDAYKPPDNVIQILFGTAVTAGCGDLVFSQHTTYQITIVLALWKYFGTGTQGLVMKIYTIIHMITFVILDIASRHHYSNDVITALYVNPMIWYLLDAFWPDPDNFDYYGITSTLVKQTFGDEDLVYVRPYTAASTFDDESPSQDTLERQQARPLYHSASSGIQEQ